MVDSPADSFASDARVVRAKQLIREALDDYQRSITGIRPADPRREQAYLDLVKEFGSIRGGDLFYPYLSSGRGRGPFVELADGSVKYDFISGIGVHHWGHAHPAIMEAVVDAGLQDTVMQGNLQQNAQSVELARLVVSTANRKGADLSHCFFTTSGAMANENALKMIFQKKSPADRVLAFEGCFAGRTLAMSQITDRPAYREGLPTLLAVDYVPFFDHALPRESTERATKTLRKHLDRHPGKHATMVFELVLGEGGFFPGEQEFFLPLMQLLKERGVAVFVDEIQTFGRLDEPFAFQHFGLDQFVDVVTIGKMSQVCATLFTDAFKPRSGLLSQTFTASTAALFTGKTIISGLMDGGYFGTEGRNAQLHAHFVKHFRAMEERHPGLIAGPYGIGAMVAFTPFRGDPDKVKRFIHALFHAGVIAFSCGGELARVRFLVPAGAVTFDHIDEVMTIVEKTLLDSARTS